MALFMRWVKLTTRLTSDPNDFVNAKTHAREKLLLRGLSLSDFVSISKIEQFSEERVF